MRIAHGYRYEQKVAQTLGMTMVATKFFDACLAMDESSSSSASLNGRMLVVKAQMLLVMADFNTRTLEFEEGYKLLKKALELDEQANFYAHYNLGFAYANELVNASGRKRLEIYKICNHHWKRFLELTPCKEYSCHCVVDSSPGRLSSKHSLLSPWHSCGPDHPILTGHSSN